MLAEMAAPLNRFFRSLFPAGLASPCLSPYTSQRRDELLVLYAQLHARKLGIPEADVVITAVIQTRPHAEIMSFWKAASAQPQR